MARKRKHSGDDHPDERWLLPYADMITLLLGLFIVLFAMSSIDAKKFDNLRTSLSQTFKGPVMTEPGSVLTGASGVLDPQAANQDPSASVRLRTEQSSDARAESQKVQQQQFQREQESLESYVKQSGLSGKMSVIASERGITIRLAGDALFKSGSAQLNAKMLKSLNFIARDIQRNRRQVAIEGHTDGAPIHSALFPSNWELSGARSLTVLHYLLSQKVLPSSVHSSGYSSTRPIRKPKYPTESIAKNRRVDIVILAPGADAGPNVDRIAPAHGGPAIPSLAPRAPVTPSGGSPNIAPAPISIIDPIRAVSQ